MQDHMILENTLSQIKILIQTIERNGQETEEKVKKPTKIVREFICVCICIY